MIFAGLRFGERLRKELLADADSTMASALSRLRVAVLRATSDETLVEDLIAGLEGYASDLADEAVKRWQKQHVPEYRPS